MTFMTSWWRPRDGRGMEPVHRPSVVLSRSGLDDPTQSEFRARRIVSCGPIERL